MAGTSALGTVATVTTNIFSIAGVQGITSLGIPTVDAEATITLTGLSATGELSTLNVWSPVVDTQTPNWRNIAA
mgnify:CR=1 FL=1